MPDGVCLDQRDLDRPVGQLRVLVLEARRSWSSSPSPEAVTHCVPPGVSAMVNVAPLSDGIADDRAGRVLRQVHDLLVARGRVLHEQLLGRRALLGTRARVPPDTKAAAMPSAMIFLIGLPPRCGDRAGNISSAPPEGQARLPDIPAENATRGALWPPRRHHG